jgi:hypothetical protein
VSHHILRPCQGLEGKSSLGALVDSGFTTMCIETRRGFSTGIRYRRRRRLPARAAPLRDQLRRAIGRDRPKGGAAEITSLHPLCPTAKRRNGHSVPLTPTYSLP